jgi:hypothetical protein
VLAVIAGGLELAPILPPRGPEKSVATRRRIRQTSPIADIVNEFLNVEGTGQTYTLIVSRSLAFYTDAFGLTSITTRMFPANLPQWIRVMAAIRAAFKPGETAAGRTFEASAIRDWRAVQGLPRSSGVVGLARRVDEMLSVCSTRAGRRRVLSGVSHRALPL